MNNKAPSTSLSGAKAALNALTRIAKTPADNRRQELESRERLFEILRTFYEPEQLAAFIMGLDQIESDRRDYIQERKIAEALLAESEKCAQFENIKQRNYAQWAVKSFLIADRLEQW